MLYNDFLSSARVSRSDYYIVGRTTFHKMQTLIGSTPPFLRKHACLTLFMLPVSMAVERVITCTYPLHLNISLFIEPFLIYLTIFKYR
jgi:hypothetical protein